jgi:predicted DNA-binding transcriptional regulator AlpA
MTDGEDEILERDEAAKLCGYTPNTFYHGVLNQLLPRPLKRGNRHVFSRQSIDTAIAKGLPTAEQIKDAGKVRRLEKERAAITEQIKAIRQGTPKKKVRKKP